MRTTLTLSDAALTIVSQYAESCDISLSQAVSDLIERSVRSKSRIKYVDGIPVFDVPTDGPTITTEDVKRLEADEL